MKQISLRKRYRLRSKEARKMVEDLSLNWGVHLDEDAQIDVGRLDDDRAFVMGGRIIAVEDDKALYLTLHGIMLLEPDRSWVVVDMGAVRFLANGADVMAPGIVDADERIEEGDIVWVRDEVHGKPLIVGKALMSGGEMKRADSGKAISTIHYVGDPIWNAEL